MKRIAILLLSAISVELSAFGQGALTPPGPPAPTMKSLDQVEPRTPISALPATITVSGSYYLTTNLTCTACGGGTNGITITVNDVSIDLQGFALIGIAGSANGVNYSGLHTNLWIHSGTVRGWSGGISAGTVINSQFSDLRLVGNAGFGLGVGQGSVIVNCEASGNGGDGFFGSASGSVYDNCTATANGGDGIQAGLGYSVKACSTSTNGVNGINLGGGSTAIGCSSFQNASNGISAAGECVVLNNTCFLNGGAGIRSTGNRNHIEGNGVFRNAQGIQVGFSGTTNVVVRNSAGNNGTAAANNFVFSGLVIFGPTNNVFNLTTGLITNQNPWANFSY